MLCRRTHPFPLEHRNARRWFVNRIVSSQLFHLLIQCLGHGIDTFLPGCRFRRLQKRLCGLPVLAVFENVGKFGIAAAVRARFGETDLDVVVTVPVQLGWRKAKRTFQFARGAGFELCPSANNGGEIALDFFSTTSPPACRTVSATLSKLLPSLEIFRRKSSGIFMSHLANGRHFLLCQHLNVHPTPLYILHGHNVVAAVVTDEK